MWVNRIFKYTRVKDDRSNDDDYKSVMPEWQVMKTHLNDVETFRSFILDDMLLMMLNNHRLSHFELDYLCPPPSLSHSHVLSFSCGPILMVRNEPSYRILCAEWMKNFTYIQFVVFCSVSIRYANEWWTTPDKCQLNFFFSMFDVSILISIFHSHSFVFIEAITSIIWLNRWETKMTNGGTFLWL